MEEFGVCSVIWLKGDSSEPVTNGHIDGYAMFAAPGALLVETMDDDDLEPPRWRQHDIATLENSIDAAGRKLRIEHVRAPRRQFWTGDPKTFAPCYLNAYVANGAVITACFGDDECDEAARNALAKAFPGRSVLMLRIDNIADGGGGVHCLTQPMPKLIGSRDIKI